MRRPTGEDAIRAAALLLAVLALEFYVIRTLAAGLVVLALLACW